MNVLTHTGSQTFSFERYKVLLKKYLAENGKTIALYTAVFFGLTILFEVFLACKLGFPDVEFMMLSNVFVWQYSVGVLSIGTAISSALMFSSMQDKAGRIGTLMLPASYIEKFAVRTTVYFVMYAITALVVLSFGEGVRYVLSPNTDSFVFALFNPTDSVNDIGALFNLSSFGKVTLSLSLIGSHATYTLGSILWPRKSFLKTTAVLMFLQFVFLIIIPWEATLEFISKLLPNVEWNDVKLLYILFTLALSAIQYAAAIYLFRKSEVVQRMM